MIKYFIPHPFNSSIICKQLFPTVFSPKKTVKIQKIYWLKKLLKILFFMKFNNCLNIIIIWIFKQFLIRFHKMPRLCLDASLGFLFPCLQVYRRKGFSQEICICVGLSFFFWLPAILYCFYLEGVPTQTNVLSIFCPPVSVA